MIHTFRLIVLELNFKWSIAMFDVWLRASRISLRLVRWCTARAEAWGEQAEWFGRELEGEM